MDIAALIAWVVTALGGFVLLGTWLTNRSKDGTEPDRPRPDPVALPARCRRVGAVDRLRPVGRDRGAAVARPRRAAPRRRLGFTMFFRWLSDHRDPNPPTTPEQRFPVVVGAHGLLGATTLVLVALVALRVERS